MRAVNLIAVDEGNMDLVLITAKLNEQRMMQSEEPRMRDKEESCSS